MKNEILKLNKVSFGEILHGISFDVSENELIVITGPNGGGKSTLAKIIMGIERPTEGHIFFCDEDITDVDVTDRALKGISYAFQQPVKIKGVTVYDILVAAGAKPEDNEEDDEKTKAENAKKIPPEEFLEKVGLNPPEYLRRELSGTLSGGELKRVEIATLLARNAKMMVFDEPEAGIDLWSFNDLVAVFRKIQKDHTIIIISHQERIIKLADRVVVLQDGKISKECSPEEFLKGVE